MSFEKQVQDWVNVDNQIKTLGNKMKELREIKNNKNQSRQDHLHPLNRTAESCLL